MAPSERKALASAWARHLASPLPRMWLGPFGGQVLRGAQPLESIVLEGPPDAPMLWHEQGGRRMRRDLPPLTLVEERAHALGRRALGHVSYEYAALLEDLPRPAGGPSNWPLLHFSMHRDEEQLDLPTTEEDAPFDWLAAATRLPEAGPLLALHPRQRHLRGVRRVREWIRAGDCYQVNLVQAFDARLSPGGAPALFAALRALHRGSAGFQALLEWPGRALVSDSPELFLARAGDRLWSRPIKGTAERTSGSPGPPGEGDSLAAAARLLASGKDRAELAMIVDLMRNDLSRVCLPGTVAVGAFPDLLVLPQLVHTCATVEGRLRPGMGLADCFRAAFPSGSITGCPRLRAMERIALLEPGVRGPCFGAIGWVDHVGDFAFNVAIRTALHEGGQLRLLAGGGLTIDSTPAAEEAESRLKAAGFARALALLAGEYS